MPTFIDLGIDVWDLPAAAQSLQGLVMNFNR